MALTKYILTKHGVREHFSQDPLENYFGQQRARGGRSDNPTAQQGLYNAGTLRVQQTLALDPVRGNSRCKHRLFDNKDEITFNNIDNTPYQKDVKEITCEQKNC